MNDRESEPHYLLIRRRDSLGYVDFLRGKYSISATNYIRTLLDSMTRDELDRLKTKPFDELWMNLWNAQNTRQFRMEYETAKRIFESFRSTGDVHGKTLGRYIAEVSTNWTEPEWGFPKGRRSPHENELACALREFTEETGLASKDIRVRSAMAPETEEYEGTNSIRYRHVYYIADYVAAPNSTTTKTTITINKENRVQTREVGDIGWFPFTDAYLKIRETNPEKRAALGRIHARILGL